MKNKNDVLNRLNRMMDIVDWRVEEEAGAHDFSGGCIYAYRKILQLQLQDIIAIIEEKEEEF